MSEEDGVRMREPEDREPMAAQDFASTQRPSWSLEPWSETVVAVTERYKLTHDFRNVGDYIQRTRQPKVQIAAGAVICDESILKGDITIGSKTVVHPRASIIAEAGPIFIGEGNIIEEMATIINRLTPGSDESEIKTQVIGNYNVFEIDSTCEALKVGDNNILETKAFVSQGVELTNGCVIGAACSLLESDTVPENTIIYGSQCQRREMNDKPYPQVGQLDFLIRVLPNYHHLRKPNTKAIKSEPIS